MLLEYACTEHALAATVDTDLRAVRIERSGTMPGGCALAAAVCAAFPAPGSPVEQRHVEAPVGERGARNPRTGRAQCIIVRRGGVDDQTWRRAIGG